MSAAVRGVGRKKGARLLKKALVISGLLTLVAFTGVNNVPPAQAACFYPHGRTTEYWAWVSNSDPNDVWCADPPLISPPFQNYYHWEQIGEHTVDCDGTIYEWGITSGNDAYGHNCGTYSKNTYFFQCDPICE
jgi:hypothetical protein